MIRPRLFALLRLNPLLILLVIFLPFQGLAQQWVSIPDLPGTARDDGVCFRVGNEAYCGTGLQKGWTPSRDLYAFHLEREEWSSISPLPSGAERQYASAFSNESHGFIFGGLSNDSYLRDLWSYDPSSDEWDERKALPAEGRSGAACFKVDGSAYIVGGKNQSKDALREVWAYHFKTGEWEQKGKIPFSGRWRASACSMNGKGYLIFGVDEAGIFLRSLFEYDPETEQWQHIANFPGNGRNYTKMLSLRGKLIIVGGMNDQGAIVGDCWSYEPVKGEWKEEEALPSEGRRGGMSFKGCSSFYYITGLDTSLKRSRKGWEFQLLSPDENESLTIHPVPGKGGFTVAVKEKLHERGALLEVFDRRGRRVIQRRMVACRTRVKLDDQASGLYIIRVFTGERLLKGKMLAR